MARLMLERIERIRYFINVDEDEYELPEPAPGEVEEFLAHHDELWDIAVRDHRDTEAVDAWIVLDADEEH